MNLRWRRPCTTTTTRTACMRAAPPHPLQPTRTRSTTWSDNHKARQHALILTPKRGPKPLETASGSRLHSGDGPATGSSDKGTTSHHSHSSPQSATRYSPNAPRPKYIELDAAYCPRTVVKRMSINPAGAATQVDRRITAGIC
ncbi:Hypothetical predicted protein [Pelobates cultripes]|uniref:Uncharacterized protein n=1 Tax=Pelobates cultripes TaxID=61616 RepID=A0AAD1QXL1_PELCU|nr:Hypothetical predicted protein [Pelobates cultripes]